ncbi:MAG TPA: ATP-binding cassette domain-containing protein [Clostridiaceae bacterium]|nr:ATP-binding cassette domain-containing protein [Clostridiaceae bacterium]
MSSTIIETRNLKKYFEVSRGSLHAVDGINLSIEEGNTLGVVGESGCGKSTLGRVILRLCEATDGQVIFEGEDILKLSPRDMNEVRQNMQIIFQDPFSSLNPRHSIFDIIADPIRTAKLFRNKKDVHAKVTNLMETVGLSQRYINAYPHEMDGGRRQRVGVARALALDPKFIVCDEPVSALDVSIQAQILNLLMDLQEERGLTYMFITHDMSVVKHISDSIMVMYMGHCVEIAPAEELFESPLHPYTQALLSAIPIPEIRKERDARKLIKGEVTSPINPNPGCRFAPRCPQTTHLCMGEDIPLIEKSKDHHVSCTLYK